MNLLFNDLLLRRFNHWVLPVAIVWSLSTAGGIFLSQSTTEGFVNGFNSFFEVFRLGEKFALVEQADGVFKGKLVTSTTLVPDVHRIKAIYRSQSDSFVSISDTKVTTIVPLHGMYKNAFRLIGLNDTSAVFRGYGKTYRLRLGFDDNLSRQEVVTRSVSDPSQTGSADNEWRSVAYKTLKEQMDNLQNIGKSIDVSPAYAGSKITGFRVNTMASTSVFAQLGILQGDVIQSVNNKKLESYPDALAIVTQLPRLRSIQITVLRNNLQKDIVYEITR